MSEDTRDFAEFFSAAWPRLFRTTYGVAGSVEDAEEALQAAFAKAYAHWRRIARMDHPEAYVRRMAVNEAISGHRRSRRRTATLAQLFEPDEMTTDEPERIDVWDAVRTLPVRQRAVVVLRYYEGLSEAEIAEVLGCRPGTVKSQASAALRNLRAQHPDLHPLSTRGESR